MNSRDKVLSFMHSHNGFITSKDVKDIGVNRYYLSTMVKIGDIVRLDRGIYGDPTLLDDELLNYQYRYQRGIFSFGTALYLHGLTDRTPRKYDMTFPQSYNLSRIPKTELRTYSQKMDLYKLGITTATTPRGNQVKVYNAEKTLCDIVRGRNKQDPELISQAMNAYVGNSKLRNIDQLARYAEVMGVDDTISKYMEVLL